MKTDFMFKGMMVPVFTPFMDDKLVILLRFQSNENWFKFNSNILCFYDRKRMVNYDVIDKYAHHLKNMGMHGIMVNGMTGEGMTLTMDERKKLAEKWLEVARKYELKMVLNIGGIDLPEIYELAEHAEKLKIDAVMLMPDLFYRPRVEEDLVMYLKDIMLHMPVSSPKQNAPNE